MKTPPTSFRAVCVLASPHLPPPPCGAASWSDDPDAPVAVLLDVDPRAQGREAVDTAAAQIPLASELPTGTLAAVLPQRAAKKGLVPRMFAGRTPITLALRATALLARGYTDVHLEGDTVCATAP